MPRTSVLAGLVVLALALGAAPTARATSILATSVEELAKLSDVVVQGVVVDSAHVLDAQGDPWTRHTLAVSASWREAVQPTVELWQRGGPLPDGSVIVIPGDLRLRVGDEIVAFVDRLPDGRLVSTSFGWSVFEVGADGRLTRHQDDLGLFVRGERGLRPARPDEITPPASLTELAARLHDVVGGAR
ncbi:MAG: hypothetical protein H6732_15010 [Alphaproteobacteria bacterium]|nr:hypothetical protein [Alphaproteobacteria bacterium]